MQSRTKIEAHTYVSKCWAQEQNLWGKNSYCIKINIKKVTNLLANKRKVANLPLLFGQAFLFGRKGKGMILWYIFLLFINFLFSLPLYNFSETQKGKKTPTKIIKILGHLQGMFWNRSVLELIWWGARHNWILSFIKVIKCCYYIASLIKMVAFSFKSTVQGSSFLALTLHLQDTNLNT